MASTAGKGVSKGGTYKVGGKTYRKISGTPSSYSGGSGGGSSSNGGGTSTPTPTESKKYYYNPITKTYSTAKIAGQTAVTKEQAVQKQKTSNQQQQSSRINLTPSGVSLRPGSNAINQQQSNMNSFEPVPRTSYWNTPFIDIRSTRFGKALKGASEAVVSEEKAGRNTGFAGRSIVAGKAATDITRKEVATGVGLASSVAYAGPVAVAKGVGISTGISEGTKFAVKAGQRQDIKQVYKEPYFKDVMGKAYNYEATKVATETSSIPYIGKAINKAASFAYFINPSLSTKKSEFEKALAVGFSEQGLKGAELNKAVEAGKIARAGGSLGEGAGLLSISTFSELYGSKNVAALSGTTAKKTFGSVFKTTFNPIARAGVVEGIGQQVVQSKSREQPIDLTKVTIAGVTGGVSAGTIGGSIIARQATKGKGKFLLGSAYLTDPFEYPGDVLAGVIEKGSKKSIVPVFSVTPTDVFITSKTTTKTSSKTRSPKSIINSVVGTSTPTKTTTKIPTFTQTNTPTNIFTTSKTNVPTFTNTFTPTDVFTNTPTNIFTTIPVNVPTQVPTNVPVTITTPTADLPLFLIPPVLPGGGGGSSIFKMPKYGSRGSQYMPSLVGLYKGKKQKNKKGFLSGFEIRGI